MQQFVTAVTFSVTICFFSPWILLLLIMGVLPAFVGESHFAFLGYSLRFRQTPARRQIDYLRVLGASKESAKELKLFGLSKYLTGRYARLSDEIYTQNVSLSKRRLLASTLFSLLSAGAYYGAYAFVIYRTVSGDLSLRSLVYLAAAIAGASNNIQQVFSSFTSIADQALFLTDFLNLFRLEPKVKSKPNAIPAPRPIRQGFEFDHVTFAYPGTTRPVLDRLNLRIEPGQRVALVGENGQGKTTLVKLITRLYDPTSGRILLDGVDLRDYDLEDLHREIAVIFQDFMRYEMTGRENIAMGKIEEIDNFSRLSAAARISLADAVLHRLPQRYEQMLGRRFEGGVDLSGGEWQKIALARAYLRDAQLLILDEPTAALDARSEREVFERFSELTIGKTALLISHRFSTVRMADRILVLEGGRNRRGRMPQSADRARRTLFKNVRTPGGQLPVRKANSFIMARIFDEQFHARPNPPGAGNAMGDMELPLDNRNQVRQISHEFHNEWLRTCGARQASKWVEAGTRSRSKGLKSRWNKAQASVERALKHLQGATPGKQTITEQQRWMLDNARFLRQASKEVGKALKPLEKLRRVQVRPEQSEIVPRAYEIATGFLLTVGFNFDEQQFNNYIAGVQQIASLEMRELWALKPLLQMVLLEQLGVASESIGGAPATGTRSPEITHGLPSTIINSLREISEMEWKEFFEENSIVDHILRSDPSGAYPLMDFESRQLYRDALSDLVRHTKLSEAEVAMRAILCARRARDRKWGMSQRATERRSNVGYYLMDHGVLRLKRDHRLSPLTEKEDQGPHPGMA